MRYGALSILKSSIIAVKPNSLLGAFTSAKSRIQGSRPMAQSSVWEEKKALRKEISKKLKQMDEDRMEQESKSCADV